MIPAGRPWLRPGTSWAAFRDAAYKSELQVPEEQDFSRVSLSQCSHEHLDPDFGTASLPGSRRPDSEGIMSHDNLNNKISFFSRSHDAQLALFGVCSCKTVRSQPVWLPHAGLARAVAGLSRAYSASPSNSFPKPIENDVLSAK